MQLTFFLAVYLIWPYLYHIMILGIRMMYSRCTHFLDVDRPAIRIGAEVLAIVIGIRSRVLDSEKGGGGFMYACRAFMVFCFGGKWLYIYNYNDHQFILVIYISSNHRSRSLILRYIFDIGMYLIYT